MHKNVEIIRQKRIIVDEAVVFYVFIRRAYSVLTTLTKYRFLISSILDLEQLLSMYCQFSQSMCEVYDDATDA